MAAGHKVSPNCGGTKGSFCSFAAEGPGEVFSKTETTWLPRKEQSTLNSTAQHAGHLAVPFTSGILETSSTTSSVIWQRRGGRRRKWFDFSEPQ